MAKLIAMVLTMMLLGLATLSQAQTPPSGPNPKGTDSSAVQGDIGTLRERKAELDRKVTNQEMEIARIEKYVSELQRRGKDEN